MECIIFVICNILFYTCIYFNLHHFHFLANLNTAWILLLCSFIITLPSFMLCFLTKKDRKKHFIFSSIWIIFSSILIFFFGKNILEFFNIKTGFANYTIYLYKYLFMFAPILSIYFSSIYKIWEQKKQLFLLIAFKYIFPIILNVLFINILEFTKILWLFALTDLFTSIISVIFVKHKN